MTRRILETVETELPEGRLRIRTSVDVDDGLEDEVPAPSVGTPHPGFPTLQEAGSVHRVMTEVLAEPNGGPADPEDASLADVLDELRQDLKIPYAFVLARPGTVLASSGRLPGRDGIYQLSDDRAPGAGRSGSTKQRPRFVEIDDDHVLAVVANGTVDEDALSETADRLARILDPPVQRIQPPPSDRPSA